MSHDIDKPLPPHGLTFRQASEWMSEADSKALGLLRKHGNLGFHELASLMGVPPMLAASCFHRLQALGFIDPVCPDCGDPTT